jgi:uncharacterized protein (DUF433 family)
MIFTAIKLGITKKCNFVLINSLRLMKYPLIVSNIEILGSKPCIKGTRISVQMILEWLASGASIHDIHNKYSHLAIEAIQQAISYASDALGNEIIIEIEHSKAA